MICECYRAEKNFLEKVGLCWGTQERDACSCGGDKSKCDFYPSVREEEKKPITNADRLRAMSDEELAEYMNDVKTWGGCPNHGARNCQEDCSNCWLDWLRQEAKDG